MISTHQVHRWFRFVSVMTAVAAAMACRPVPVAAQIPTEPTQCRQTASAALQRRMAKEVASELRALGQCNSSAGEVLPTFWHSPPTDTIGLRDLVLASAHVRDDRIRRAVEAAARDRTQPLLVRHAAIGVLASYSDPTLLPSVTRGGVVIGTAFHPFAIEGAERLPASTKGYVIKALREMQAIEERGTLYNVISDLLRELTAE